MHRDQGFPFWRLVLAVALGVLIANGITSLAGLVFARIVLQSAAEQLQRETAAVAAKSRETLARSQAELRQQQANERDWREGPYVQPATDRLRPGDVGCMNGTVVRREANGWTQMNGGSAGPLKCRTVR
jgi:hypothetical protein